MNKQEMDNLALESAIVRVSNSIYELKAVVQESNNLQTKTLETLRGIHFWMPFVGGASIAALVMLGYSLSK